MIHLSVTLLVLVILGVSFTPQLSPFLNRHKLGLSFIFTFVAAFAGVLLAMHVADYERKLQDKADLIKVIEAAEVSVTSSFDVGHELYKFYQSLTEKSEAKEQFFKKNPLPYPAYIDVFIVQDLVSRNISAASLAKLNDLLIKMKKTHDNAYPLYLHFLQQLQQLLRLELSFQRGEIEYHYLQSQYSTMDQQSPIQSIYGFKRR